MLPALAVLATLSAACPEAANPCARLVVYVAADPAGQPVVDDAWLGKQLAAANAQFAPAGVVFEIAAVHRLPAAALEITSRAQRDRLGRGRLRDGALGVFVVGRLASVDEPGDIRGVHWRDRADPRRRFIILSRIAPPLVLAHELGHHYGLRHSSDPVSLMNKTPRAEPPPELRRFTDAELAIIRDRTRRLAPDRSL